MTRVLACILTLGLLVGGGLVHGYYAERWRSADDLEHGVERLPTVPLEIDGWKAEERESDAAEFAQAGARGFWTRTYRKDGHEVLAILMVGRAGRMSVHTPEVCYRGAGYELSGPPVRHEAKDGAEKLAAFWTATFAKPGTTGSELQLYWGWNGGDGWKAPTSPRWEFAGRPALYKLYLSQVRAGTDADERHVDEFLRSFLPALDDAVSREGKRS
jgi:Protein of unknown function (DUF3485)